MRDSTETARLVLDILKILKGRIALEVAISEPGNTRKYVLGDRKCPARGAEEMERRLQILGGGQAGLWSFR